MIPPVVLNAIITSGNKHNFSDNTDWVGDSYLLHDFGDYKVIDSAQKLEKNRTRSSGVKMLQLLAVAATVCQYKA